MCIMSNEGDVLHGGSLPSRRRTLFGRYLSYLSSCVLVINFYTGEEEICCLKIIAGDANGGAWGDDPGDDSDPEDVADNNHE